MAVLVHAANMDDLPALIEAEQAAFGAAAWSEASLRGALESAACVVLLATDGAPLGHAIGQIAGDIGEVLELGVMPSARRRGVGRALLGALEEALIGRGAAEIWLELRADNPGALALYQADGFGITGIRRRYYTDGTDAVLMGKRR